RWGKSLRPTGWITGATGSDNGEQLFAVVTQSTRRQVADALQLLQIARLATCDFPQHRLFHQTIARHVALARFGFAPDTQLLQCGQFLRTQFPGKANLAVSL